MSRDQSVGGATDWLQSYIIIIIIIMYCGFNDDDVYNKNNNNTNALHTIKLSISRRRGAGSFSTEYLVAAAERR